MSIAFFCTGHQGKLSAAYFHSDSYNIMVSFVRRNFDESLTLSFDILVQTVRGTPSAGTSPPRPRDIGLPGRLPNAVATHGRPTAMASMSGKPQPSPCVGITNASTAWYLQSSPGEVKL